MTHISEHPPDNGDYILTFQTKRNGATLVIEIGPDNRKARMVCDRNFPILSGQMFAIRQKKEIQFTFTQP